MTLKGIEPENIPWGAGCLAYDLTRHALIQQSLIEPWLRVIDGSMRFIFSIGSVPVRFYKGDPEEPTDRTLSKSYPELRQLALAYEKRVDAEKFRWRFAVETAIDGTASQISLVGIDFDDTVECRWEFDERKIVPISAATTKRPEGKRIGPPAVGPKGAGKDEDVSSEEI
jgi:hypothetical protein